MVFGNSRSHPQTPVRNTNRAVCPPAPRRSSRSERTVGYSRMQPRALFSGVHMDEAIDSNNLQLFFPNMPTD